MKDVHDKECNIKRHTRANKVILPIDNMNKRLEQQKLIALILTPGERK